MVSSVGFVGRVRFSGEIPAEICLMFVPTEERYISSVVCQGEVKKFWDLSNAEDIRHTILNFYVKADRYSHLSVGVVNEEEKRFFREIGLPATIVPDVRWKRFKKYPTSILFDMNDHVEKYHGGNDDEECTVKKAWDLRDKILDVQKSMLIESSVPESFLPEP